jgi:hypothetical protein
MRLAGEPLQVLRGSGRPGPALPGAHAAGTGDGRHPRLCLAGLSSPGLGPQGNLFLPLVGRLGADRELIPIALAIAAGGHAKAVQARLCHCSATMTLDRYGHLMEDLDSDVAERLGDAAPDGLETAWQRLRLQDHQREGWLSEP